MKRKLALFAMMIIGYGCMAQNRDLINSLKHKLSPLVFDQQQFDVLMAISWEYRFAMPDSSIRFAEDALALGEKIELKKNLAKPYNFIGIALNYKGDRLQSLAYHQKALGIAQSQGDSVQLAHSNNTIGRLLFEQGLLQQAFSYYIKALEIFTAIADSSGIGYVKASLANLYLAQQNYKKAEEAYEEVVAMRSKENDPSRMMFAFIQLGSFFNHRKQIAKSNQYLLKADSIGRILKDEINRAEIKVLLGENFLIDGNVRAAKNIGSMGYSTIKATSNVRKLPRGLLLMGKIYLAEKNYTSAIKEFNEALSISKSSKASAFEMESYFQLAQAEKSMGHEKEEFYNMNRYLTLKDSVLDLELARRVEQVQFELKLEATKKETELLQLRQAKSESDLSTERLRNTIYLILVIFVLVALVITFFVYRRQRIIYKKLEEQNKKIDHQNEMFQRQNTQMEEANHEKNTVMNIVAHDLKSPLNRIAGLSTLIRLEGPLTAPQESYLQKLNDVTQSGVGLIKDLLELSDLTDVKEGPLAEQFNVSDLFNNHLESFRPLAISKGICLASNIPPQLVFTSNPSDLSRILDNLVSNAIKFSPLNKTVAVSLVAEDDKITIIVKDEGPGFSEEDKKSLYKKFTKLSARPTGLESSNGLGLAIVRALVDRLGGSIDLQTEQNGGSEFTVRIPSM